MILKVYVSYLVGRVVSPTFLEPFGLNFVNRRGRPRPEENPMLQDKWEGGVVANGVM